MRKSGRNATQSGDAINQGVEEGDLAYEEEAGAPDGIIRMSDRSVATQTSALHTAALHTAAFNPAAFPTRGPRPTSAHHSVDIRAAGGTRARNTPAAGSRHAPADLPPWARQEAVERLTRAVCGATEDEESSEAVSESSDACGEGSAAVEVAVDGSENMGNIGVGSDTREGCMAG